MSDAKVSRIVTASPVAWAKAIETLESATDEGPSHEGWASRELEEARLVLREAYEKNPVASWETVARDLAAACDFFEQIRPTVGAEIPDIGVAYVRRDEIEAACAALAAYRRLAGEP